MVHINIVLITITIFPERLALILINLFSSQQLKDRMAITLRSKVNSMPCPRNALQSSVQPISLSHLIIISHSPPSPSTSPTTTFFLFLYNQVLPHLRNSLYSDFHLQFSSPISISSRRQENCLVVVVVGDGKGEEVLTSPAVLRR